MTAQAIPVTTATPASPHAPLDPTPSQLITTLSEQRDLYLRLKSLSARQASLIETGRTQELLAVLGERQQLVESLSAIHEKLGPQRGRLPQIAGDMAEHERQTIRELVDQVQTLLESIIEQDEQDRQQLATAQADVGHQLRQVAKTGAAVNAYRAARTQPTEPARFTDRRG